VSEFILLNPESNNDGPRERKNEGLSGFFLNLLRTDVETERRENGRRLKPWFRSQKSINRNAERYIPGKRSVKIFPRKEQFELAERKQERSRRRLCVWVYVWHRKRPVQNTQHNKLKKCAGEFNLYFQRKKMENLN